MVTKDQSIARDRYDPLDELNRDMVNIGKSATKTPRFNHKRNTPTIGLGSNEYLKHRLSIPRNPRYTRIPPCSKDSYQSPFF